MGQRCTQPEPRPARSIRIIASCTQGKRCSVSPDLRLGTIPQGSLSQRFEAWRDRLQQSRIDRVAAIDLYRGQHWAVARELPVVAQSSGYQAELWIASAGYGLVSSKTQISPYSATFVSSEEDSVWRPGDGERRMALRAWWKSLQAIPGPSGSRSIAALASESVEAIILVVASPSYVSAMAEDLVAARAALADPRQLIVISSRDNSLPTWLNAHLVPSEAPLSSMLGGSLGALHARTARLVLQEATDVPLRADVLVPRYTQLVSETEAVAAPARLKLPDEAVLNFIRDVTTQNRRLTCTSALRRLRDAGQACEQKRFAGLYAEVMRRGNAS